MRFFGDWEAFWREGFGGDGLRANGGLEIERALGAEEGLRMGENLKNESLRGGEYDIAAISRGARSEGVSEALEFAYMRYEARRRIGRVSLVFWDEDSIDVSSWESKLLDLLDYGVEMEIFIGVWQSNGEELANFFRAFGVVYWLKSRDLLEKVILFLGWY